MFTELCNEKLSKILNHYYCRSERLTKGTADFLHVYVKVTTVTTTT